MIAINCQVLVASNASLRTFLFLTELFTLFSFVFNAWRMSSPVKNHKASKSLPQELRAETHLLLLIHNPTFSLISIANSTLSPYFYS